jgi:hypothetical protein
MKTFGVLFVIGGVFWTIAGIVSYASDIQLGIAVSGINMIGIGSIMVHLGFKADVPVESN